MTTINTHAFGEVITVENPDNTGYSVRLKFSTGLGNNFSYSHFVDSILNEMKVDNEQELFVEWCRSIDLDSDLIIYDVDGLELNTCASDFNDHTRDAWLIHCNENY